MDLNAAGRKCDYINNLKKVRKYNARKIAQQMLSSLLYSLYISCYFVTLKELFEMLSNTSDRFTYMYQFITTH